MDFHYSGEEAVPFSWDPFYRVKRKGELLALLKEATGRYTPADPEEMLARYAKKLCYVPKEYADALMVSARTQIAGGYHALMTAELSGVHAAGRLRRSWTGFVREAAGSSGRLRSLKYLIAGFTMYIPEEPAHPVGTPFPGGYTVELHEGVYYCPVRAAQGEVDAALCRFCPAVQSRERDLVLTRAERAFVEKEEKLENYFYHFKG
jgi:hypothetical protein